MTNIKKYRIIRNELFIIEAERRLAPKDIMSENNSESREMYLKTISILKERNGKVKAKDVAEELNISPAAVSKAFRILVRNGYIQPDHATCVNFTPLGEEKAESLCERFRIVSLGLQKLGVPPELAHETACKMEHVLSDEVFEIIKKHITEEKL